MIRLSTFDQGKKEESYEYSYFLPTMINQEWDIDDQEITLLLEKAAVKLGELNAYARFVPNMEMFIKLHVTKEAVVSSKIEGTQTNMNEAFLPKEEIDTPRQHDWQEVKNYIDAMSFATEQMESLPLSSRLIRNTHKVLLQGVRGERKLPGEYRTSQNWIGGASLSDAVFIPPHHTHIDDLISDLEHFLHNQSIKVPSLIRIGIAHYQFETIHPFLDGNGRIGRLMITLFLVSEGILEKPLLYLSNFFEQSRYQYYDNLTNVRTRGDMIQWLKYFLTGIETTAVEAVNKLTSVLDLKSRTEIIITEAFGRRSKSGHTLLMALWEQPIVKVEDVKSICSLSFKAANDLVALMVDQNILNEMTGQSRNRLFIFNEYLGIFE